MVYIGKLRVNLQTLYIQRGFLSRVTKFEKKWANLFALVFFFFFLFFVIRDTSIRMQTMSVRTELCIFALLK